MKKLFLVLLLLPTISTVAQDINMYNFRNDKACKRFQMPSEKELKEILKKDEFGYFDQKTKLSQHLGHKEVNPLEVVYIIDAALYRFDQNITEKTAVAVVHMRRRQLIEAVLSPHKDATKCLEKYGFLGKR